MAEILDTVLLLALPASGKSEVRTYLAGVDAETCRRDFHLGPTVQLDDFPYVHMMRQIDDALVELSKDRVFFEAPDKSFVDPRDWGTLIQLINEDYADLVAKKEIRTESAATWMTARLDAAREKVGAVPALGKLSDHTRTNLMAKIEQESQQLLDDKLANYPESLDGKTLVIEFARGGKEGSSMPLLSPYGYAYSVAQLSPEILDNAGVLYVWVTPEESRRKNEARADPDDPGSILHHGVPEFVMRNDYGCDDMDHLVSVANAKNTIPIEAHGKTYNLPMARFDNRVDKTSFVRNDKSDWETQEVDALHGGLSGALTTLFKLRG